MLRFPGGPAFSEFRIRRLLENLRQDIPAITGIKATYLHFVDDIEPAPNAAGSGHSSELSAALDSAALSKLMKILDYIPRAPTGSDTGIEISNSKNRARIETCRLVVPRIGTISPWSSKATDIVKICGLDAIRRVERGIAYTFFSEVELDPPALLLVDSLIHDRMTETVLDDEQEAEQLFSVAQARPLGFIPLQENGVSAIEQANADLGLALTQDEIEYLADAFVQLQRDPTDVELMMFAQANSEHCRHKTFRASWTLDGEPQPHSLMDMIQNTYRHTNGEDVLSAYEDNASVIAGLPGSRFYPDPVNREFGYSRENIHILMKVETHNHPTAIAPFPGAATGSGGEIRDEGAVGRGSRPKVGLTGYSVSNLCIPDLAEPWEIQYGRPARIASALDIMLEGPIGGAAFNNEFGRPNINGYFRTFEAEFDGEVRGYHKPIMIAGGLGNIREEHVEQKSIEPGASLIVLGGPAMLIGLGGGAASSMASGTSDAALDFASVQRGNPEMEHRCQEVIDHCWQLGPDNPIQFIHDVGAGGLSNALPELVKDGSVGGQFELRDIPNDEPGMSPLEIWCNEAQERYVLAIAETNMPDFVAVCERERCPYAIVGKAIDSEHLLVNDRLLESKPVDLPMSVLFGKAPKMHRIAETKVIHPDPVSTDIDFAEAVDRVIGHPAVASKNFLVTIGDRTVGGMVARDQMIGPWQIPVSDVAVTTNSYRDYQGEAMAMGERTPVALLDAPASGRLAVVEAITNIAAAKIARIQDIKLSANWMAAVGHPGEDANLYKTVAAVGLDLCPALGICIPVGKDSMSMKTSWQDNGEERTVTSPLSLIISAFAPVVDVRETLTPELSPMESTLLLLDLSSGQQRLAGSILAQCTGQAGNEAPDVDDPRVIASFFKLLQDPGFRHLILAYHDRSDGGLFTTLIEMCFAGRLGLSINIPDDADPIAYMFNEECGVVIQIADQDLPAAIKAIDAAEIEYVALGSVNMGTGVSVEISHQGSLLFKASRSSLQERWSEVSYNMQKLRDNPACAEEEYSSIADDEDPGLSAFLTFDLNEDVAAPMIATGARPRIAILREQGVNSQVEMAAAFTHAGFSAIDVHMSEILTGKTSLQSFVGVIACGGFSYGDVLGAGEGWAKSILFNTIARQEFSEFFNRNDTFGLGVCNGCQMFAAIKELIPGAQSWPRFITNRSEQFEARLSLVQIQDSPSILLSGMAGSHMPIAISHGEGRARVDVNGIEKLTQTNQIAMRFIDNRLAMTDQYPMNPNGSPQGITGVTTPDGRFTAMMPHPERVFRAVQHSWHPDEWIEDSPWMRIFRNARMWVG